jgi:GDP/UDP-N,N'-diacetylbacillosamine 2-epimerase (hydrolysing)
MRKICFITGSRAEYGLLSQVIKGVQDDDELSLQVIVTGMHLSPEFGLTFHEIEQDGFHIDYKVEILSKSDSPNAISKSMGHGLIGFADAFTELQPDLIVVLGDRFEILSAVASAQVFKIPVAHIHGGELTEGLCDDAFRHAITKMSHIHFVAAEEYQTRVIQLGEQPESVFLSGGLGVDIISKVKLLSREELERSLNFKFGSKNLLITFHPVTLENNTSSIQMRQLLISLKKLNNTKLIFTLPNADSGGRELIKIVERFVSQNSNSCSFKSLGQLRYLSCVNQVDAVVGNSSSALLEVPSFKKGTLNIGDRQKGRLQSKSVINCDSNSESISTGLELLYSDNFRTKLQKAINPYGSGGATEFILSKIKGAELKGIIVKKFYDLHSS